MPGDLDIVIIGAGAAGIAAARALATAGASVRVVEARNRAGGRAFTRLESGRGLDMGCGWLHSADDNLLTGMARTAGYHIDESDPPWQRPPDANLFPADQHRQFRAAHEAFDQRLADAAKASDDMSANLCLEDGCVWNGVLDAISTYVNGVELDRLSVMDVSAYRDSEINFRITGGLGTFVAGLAADIAVTHNCAARRIDHSGAKLLVQTPAGDMRCDKVIVTVPTNVLAGGGLRFFPDLPDVQHAAAHLPLGVANKIFLAVDQAEELPLSSFLIANRGRVAAGSYHLRPFGWPMIEGYFGGAYARELEAAGPQAFADQAISELCSALGNSWRRWLRPVASSAWVGDPFAQGSYSHALPGFADQRAALAQPHEDRILFAGEATSPHYFSTVHGAYESGLRAARQALGLDV